MKQGLTINRQALPGPLQAHRPIEPLQGLKECRTELPHRRRPFITTLAAAPIKKHQKNLVLTCIATEDEFLVPS